MADPLMYNPSPEFLCEIMEKASRGEDVGLLCPKCSKPLIVALTFAKAAELGVHPGIYGPTSPSHVYRMFTLRPSDAGPMPKSNWLDQHLKGESRARSED